VTAPTPEPIRPPPTRRRNLVFTGLSFVLFLALFEGFLGLAAWWIGPQTHLPEDGSVAAPQADAVRVVAVGDSWVYGAESEPHEAFIQVFRRQVESATGRTVQVYNLGVSASNSAQALVRLHSVIDLVEPDYVVVLTGANNLLHDSGVAEAARLMGEDARMVPGLTALSRLRIVRLARLIWINNFADVGTREDGPGDPAAAPPLLTVSGGTDPTGSTGLPKPPAIEPIPVFDGMPWWSMFARRQWKIGLGLVSTATPPEDTPAQRGLIAAWEALFLAHLDRFEEAEAKAALALELGGDEAVAHEARAVSAERRNRPLEALQHRLRSADSAGGHPWISARARALVLMELEMWEASLAWLLPVLDAVPGNLEALTALARLPGAARTPAVEEHLSRGPRNSGIRQAEYFEWHRISSGMLDRMEASLGTPDPGEVEPPDLLLARARLAEETDRPEDAAVAYAALLEADLPRDRARAWAGFVRTRGSVPEGPSPPLDGVTAAALVGMHRSLGDCDEALRVGQAGLAAGLAAMAFERAAGDCLSREVGWSLTEQALGRGPILDRVALILGLPAGEVRGPVPPPQVPWWPMFRERRFEELLADSRVTPGWRALALAHMERPAEALAAADEADAAGTADPSAVALARAMAADQRGDFRTALIERVRAAEATAGHSWLRHLARGTAQAAARRWKAAQRDLLGVLRAAPGYLEALEVLAEVPEQVRFDATQTVLRWTPSGYVPRHRWSRWYASQGRDREVELALRWPDAVAQSPLERAEVQFAEARLAFDGGDSTRGHAGLADAVIAFTALDRPDRVCVLRTYELDLRPDDVSDEELERLAGDCGDHPSAMELAGRLATRKSRCDHANVWVRAALEAGADPADLLDWIDPCTPTETFEIWVRGSMERPGVPALAAAWMSERMHPQEEEDPVRVGRSYSADALLRHLDAMARLSRAQGAEFLALTYPFPGAHHLRVRDAVVAGAGPRDLPVLDLYGHFQSTYSEADWQAMRTPEDHIDATGYREMGEVLFRAWFEVP
jgi:hypothetical protein